MSEKHPTKGFAGLSIEARKAIASKGGKAAHAKGTAHQWTSAEARVAGTKGGRNSSRRTRRVVSTT